MPSPRAADMKRLSTLAPWRAAGSSRSRDAIVARDTDGSPLRAPTRGCGRRRLTACARRSVGTRSDGATARGSHSSRSPSRPDVEPVADRVRLRYRFHGAATPEGLQNEHTAYATVAKGRVVALNLSCAGFRPGASELSAGGGTRSSAARRLPGAASRRRAGRTEPSRPTASGRGGARGARRHRAFLHQAETWEAVGRGESVVVTTGTARGKPLAFSLPVLDAIT